MRRLGAPSVPMPFSPDLERALLPGAEAIVAAAETLPGREPVTVPQHTGRTASRDTPALIGRPVKVARAYEQLADVLRDSIQAGRAAEGERLPSETKLAEQAGVSRSTVREALRILQQGGLIERASPKVMVVSRHIDGPAHRELTAALHRRNVTFHHLHEALLTIEPELTRLATERASDAEIAALRANVDAQERHLEDYVEWCRLDEEFHLAIAEMSGNPALIITRTPITNLLLPGAQPLHQLTVADAPRASATTTGSSPRSRRATRISRPR